MTAAAHLPKQRTWRGPKWGLAFPSFVWYILFFVAPIAVIVVYSFGAKDSSKLVPVDLGNLNFENYRQVFTADFFDVFRATLEIAVVATLLCLLIGFPVSYFTPSLMAVPPDFYRPGCSGSWPLPAGCDG